MKEIGQEPGDQEGDQGDDPDADMVIHQDIEASGRGIDVPSFSSAAMTGIAPAASSIGPPATTPPSRAVP